MSEGVKFPRSLVDEVLSELLRLLDPTPALQRPVARCNRVAAVGGYRRQKREMKDLELLYVPRFVEEEDFSDLFGKKVPANLTEKLWDELLLRGVLAKRPNTNGHVSAWGPHNKHAVHVATGLAIDLFSTCEEHWHNRIVVTTGSRESNIRIAAAARAMHPGWEWEVAAGGFVPLGQTWEAAPRNRRAVHHEREVFGFVGLPFLPPERRV